MSVYLQVGYNGKDILCDVTQLSLNYPLLGDFITGNLTRGQQVTLPCYLCIEKEKVLTLLCYAVSADTRLSVD